MMKKNDPNAKFGITPYSFLSNIDQKQLNTLYCKFPKVSLVKHDLAKTLTIIQNLYRGSKIPKLAEILRRKLYRIYPNYWFSMIFIELHVGNSNYAVKPTENNCIVYTAYGQDRYVCWVQQGSVTGKQRQKFQSISLSAKQAMMSVQVYCI